MTHPLTKHLSESFGNHASEDCVALDELVPQFTTLLVGDREGSIDNPTEQLRRDMRRERNKAVRSILRVIRSDLHKGKSPEDVAKFSDALSAMIRTHSPRCQGNLSDEIVDEGDVESLENPLEARVLRGDTSRPTLTKLGRTIRLHIQKLQGCDKALNAKLYGSQP